MTPPLHNLSRWRARQRGATLIEAMVASIVFLIGAMGVMGYLAYGRASLRSEGRSRIAAEVAHSRIEELRTVAYDSLSAYVETDTAVQVGGAAAERVSSELDDRVASGQERVKKLLDNK